MRHCWGQACAVSWLLVSQECWAPGHVCRVHQGHVHGRLGSNVAVVTMFGGVRRQKRLLLSCLTSACCKVSLARAVSGWLCLMVIVCWRELGA